MGRYSPIDDATLDEIAAAGYDVYMPSEGMQTYAFYTDGVRIGYIQRDYFGGWSISTVHVPNHETGTGFRVGEMNAIIPEVLRDAFMHAPSWADSQDRASVVKWKDMDAFLASRNFVALAKVRDGT